MAWLILAGRGYGKTRTGAEFVAERMRTESETRAALVAATFDDGRDTMVEGESGLEAILQREKLVYRWNRSLGQLILANGSRADIYSSEKPRQLRGPQHHIAWGDEPAYWRDAPLGDAENTTWSNLKLGLRLGDDPRCILTTTPLPNKLVKALSSTPEIVVTRGSTYENLENLTGKFRREVVNRYEGTRLGRQELYAEILDDVPGALVRREMIAYGQGPLTPQDGALRPSYLRVVVAIDPAVSYGPDSDETGLLVVAKAIDGNGYVLSDESGHYSPQEWGRRGVALSEQYGADAIIGEVNNGGDMVESTLRSVGFNGRFIRVSASRGKRVRAEPISAGYERQLNPQAPGFRIFHVRPFAELEDQWCNFTPDSPISPDRVDAEVWGMTELFPAVAAVEGPFSMIG